MDKLYHVYKGFPPNLCCSDAALRPLSDGRLAVFFLTGGTGEPEIDNHVAVTFSEDSGRTWNKVKPVFHPEKTASALSEVTVSEDKITIYLITHDGSFGHWKNFTMTSEDCGLTWSEPQPFVYFPVRTCIRNEYHSTWGETFMPFQFYNPRLDSSPSSLFGKHLCENGVLVGKGKTNRFERFGSVGPTKGWAENNVVELSDGKLVMLIRADCQGTLSKASSSDKGRTWSEIQRTDIPNPGSKFRLFRMSSGKIILLHNPSATNRNPLSIWISDDDMNTWFYRRDVVTFPGQLQYPDGFLDEKDNRLHFAFDYNRHDIIYACAEL